MVVGARDAAGQLEATTYPGGTDHILGHFYDGVGRLVRLNWRGQPLLIGITWNPLGQATGWTWAATSGGVVQATMRTYNTAGRLTQVTAGGQTVLGYVYEAAGRITSLSQLLAAPVNAADPNTAVTAGLRSWLVSYDAVGRLISFNQLGTTAATGYTAGFSYDVNGNRTAGTRVLGALGTSRSYALTGSRMTGFTQTIGGATTNAAYTYNANGDLTSDGLRSYAFDVKAAPARLPPASPTAARPRATPTTPWASASSRPRRSTRA